MSNVHFTIVVGVLFASFVFVMCDAFVVVNITALGVFLEVLVGVLNSNYMIGF